MIKNIVFDLGGVLVDYNPEKYLVHLGFSKEDVKFFSRIIFYGKEWNQYNSSIYNLEQTKNTLIKNYPKYSNKIEKICNNIDYKYILFEMKDTANYLKDLKDKGYNIYILSDMNADSYKYNIKFNFFNYVDGGVYSFEIGTTKPNKNNYLTLLKKYNLVPEETIFIDDRLENVNSADNYGIHGIQFTTLEEVKKKVSFLENNEIRGCAE